MLLFQLQTEKLTVNVYNNNFVKMFLCSGFVFDHLFKLINVFRSMQHKHTKVKT